MTAPMMPDLKIDRWTYFMLTHEDRQLFDHYAGPCNETSILKDLPIQVLDLAKRTMRRVELLTGRKLRVIYRGPRRRYCHQSCTWKQDAERFAVYFR